jgi:hypothetical protein
MALNGPSILSIFERHIGNPSVGYGLGEAVAEETGRCLKAGPNLTRKHSPGSFRSGHRGKGITVNCIERATVPSAPVTSTAAW